MDRREKLLMGLDLSSQDGAEIGALTRPIVSRADGRIFYIDHVDTQTLRQKYSGNNLNAEDFVEVDGVWGDNTIAEALGPDHLVDYIIASHVVEHVPDLVSWLQELSSVLKPGGTIRLAAPDRRFCFDYRREDTRVADVLAAHLAHARRPQPREVIDFKLHHTDVDLSAAWDNGGDPVPLNAFQLDHAFDQARRSAEGAYVDVHCWAFTLASFARLMAQLAQVGLTRLACVEAFDTEIYQNEFVVIMQLAAPGQAAESWRRIAEEGKAVASPAPQTWPQVRRDWLVRGQKAMVEQYESEAANLRRERDAARAEVTDIRRSTSWRLTRPLRAAVQRLRGASKPG